MNINTTSPPLPSPRTNIHDLAKQVLITLEKQQEYFNAIKSTHVDARRKLQEAKDSERYIKNLARTILSDKSEIDQFNLFSTQDTTQKFEGLIDPRQLVDLYSRPIRCKVENKDGKAWIPREGNVNAMTIHFAELRRLKELEILED
jgi:hypothetical protein